MTTLPPVVRVMDDKPHVLLNHVRLDVTPKDFFGYRASPRALTLGKTKRGKTDAVNAAMGQNVERKT